MLQLLWCARATSQPSRGGECCTEEHKRRGFRDGLDQERVPRCSEQLNERDSRSGQRRSQNRASHQERYRADPNRVARGWHARRCFRHELPQGTVSSGSFICRIAARCTVVTTCARPMRTRHCECWASRTTARSARDEQVLPGPDVYLGRARVLLREAGASRSTYALNTATTGP